MAILLRLAHVALLVHACTADAVDSTVKTSEHEIADELGFEAVEEEIDHEAQIKLVVEHFNEIDTDGNGKIDYDELSARFRDHMDKHFKEAEEHEKEERRAQFAKKDISDDSEIDLNEFFYGRRHELSKNEKQHETELFKLFDADKNGKLAFDE